MSKEQLVAELSQITVERQQLIDHIARLTEEQAEKERVSTEECMYVGMMCLASVYTYSKYSLIRRNLFPRNMVDYRVWQIN